MRRTTALWLAAAMLATPAAMAQFAVPVSKASPETLFRNQCATCHSLSASEPARQGPTLYKVIGRHVGSVPEFKYSSGFAHADFAWDDSHLDKYLTNPQSVVPGAVMPYRQPRAEVRKAIISYLEAQR